ncbi:hypothetical protein E8E11_009028 [Didymella keratinophila]|nr:hypothetical protein E8E11_009028 [Didymella keratinophila]
MTDTVASRTPGAPTSTITASAPANPSDTAAAPSSGSPTSTTTASAPVDPSKHFLVTLMPELRNQSYDALLSLERRRKSSWYPTRQEQPDLRHLCFS